MSDPAVPYGSAGTGMQVGKYRLLRRLAAGGMAEVFLATDDGNNLWAVKLMLPHLTDQPEFLGLFLDEARLASQLNHANVARVKDMGMEDGRLFIAMEYVRGQPLSNLLYLLKERGQGLTPAQAAEIVAQSAAGLNAAHIAKGRDGKPLELVHRDVSPQNLLLTDEGMVKVVDFGIAKARNKLVVTQANTTRGKPWYMSPEQMRGEPLDARADVFALGAVLFELIAGVRLFDGDVDQVMYKALNEPLPDLAKVKPDAPTELVELIAKSCAYKQDDRQETAWEMEQELRAYIAGVGGAGDMGALIREHFPAMPTTVAEITGEEPAPAAKPRVPSRPRSAEARPPTNSNSNSRPRGLAYTRPKQEVAAPASARSTTVPENEAVAEPAEFATARDAGEAYASRAKISAKADAPSKSSPASAAKGAPAPAAAKSAPASAKAPPVGATQPPSIDATLPPAPAVLSDPTAPTPAAGGSKAGTIAAIAVGSVVLVGGGGFFAWKMAAKEEAAQATQPVAAPVAPPPSLLAKKDVPPPAPTGTTEAPAAPTVAGVDGLVPLDLTKAKPGMIRVASSTAGMISVDGKPKDASPIELSLTPDHDYVIGFAPYSDPKAKTSRKVHVDIGKTSFVFFGGSAKNIFSGDEALRQGIADMGLGKTARGLEEIEFALSHPDSHIAEEEAEKTLGHYFLAHDSPSAGLFHLESWLRMLKQQPHPSADKIAEAQKEVDAAKKQE